MTKHSHDFVETYEDFIGFGFDRKTDENTVIYYLQKFSDDQVMKTIIPKMSEKDLETLFDLISKMLKKHLSDEEYHRIFLKEDRNR
ncbi:MAG: cytoplasmic protein [Thermodesulfobacteriota bacterium]